jgi:hypothetical protein
MSYGGGLTFVLVGRALVQRCCQKRKPLVCAYAPSILAA